ncbi:hypothetical protein [Arthrobacter sp. AK01]|nr:hypothetical protein [Arthrobacter sp. AK01]
MSWQRPGCQGWNHQLTATYDGDASARWSVAVVLSALVDGP